MRRRASASSALMTGGRLRTLSVVASAMAIVVLVVLGYLIADSQSKARHDLEKRFRDRAVVSAALTNAIFASAASSGQSDAADRFSGPRVSQAALDGVARRGNLVYARILDARGQVLAATSSAPPAAPGAALSPWVARAAKTSTSQLSDVIPDRGKAGVVEWAVPFRSPQGPRIELSGINERLIAGFLAGFLRQLPNFATGASSSVVDSKGRIVGSPVRGAVPGAPLRDAALLAALRKKAEGGYGSGRYFTSAPVAGSSWKVVLASTRDDLYASVNGGRRTVQWLVFGVLAVALLAGLVLLRRVANATSRLERQELNQRHAMQINDNVLQRLTLAKYAMERGDDAVSRDRLVETMREAQDLINQLLGEDEVEPGALRRETGAPGAGHEGERAPSTPET
jgi:hypothetical protein